MAVEAKLRLTGSGFSAPSVKPRLHRDCSFVLAGSISARS